MKKKILITTESLVMGGVETALLSLIKTLKKYDVDIDLFVLEKGILNDEFEKLTKVNIIDAELPKNKLISRIMKTLLCKSIYKKYRKNNNKKYDIAIAFYGINNYCDLYAAAANAKQKFIWVHNNFETTYKFSKIKFIMKLRNILMAKKFKYFDNIIVVSENTKNEFNNIFNGFSDSVIVINNIFDIDKIKTKDDKCEKLPGKNKIFFVGRLDPIKNLNVLIDEFAIVNKDISNTYLYIIGSGPEEQKLKNLINEKNLRENVIFLGNKNNPISYMNQADIIVLPSKSESYGIVLLEALALGKYFITTPNGGGEEIFNKVNNGNLNNGIVCTENEIHNKILYYLNNKDKFKTYFNINNVNVKTEQQIKKLFNLNNK